MNRLNGLDYAAFTLAIIGALNWLLVGLFRFDLVAAIFGGPTSMLSRLVYTLVGIAGVYCIYALTKVSPAVDRRRAVP